MELNKTPNYCEKRKIITNVINNLEKKVKVPSGHNFMIVNESRHC